MAFKKGWFKGAGQQPNQALSGRSGSKGGRGNNGDKRRPQRVLGLASLRWGVPKGSTELCPSTFFVDLWVRPVGNGNGENKQIVDPVIGRWSLFTPQGVDPCSGQMVPQRQHQYWVDSLKLPLPSKEGEGSRHLDLLRLSFAYYVLLSRVLLSEEGEPLLDQFLAQFSDSDAESYQEYLKRVFDSGYLHLLSGDNDSGALVDQSGLTTSVFAYTVQFVSEESVRNGVSNEDVTNAFGPNIGAGTPVLVALSGVHWPKTTLLSWVTQWVNHQLSEAFQLDTDNVVVDQVLAELPHSLQELVEWARQCDRVPHYLVSLAVSCTQLATGVLGQVDGAVRGKMVMPQENVGANGVVDRRLYFVVNGGGSDKVGGGFKGRGGKGRRSVWSKGVSHTQQQTQEKPAKVSGDIGNSKEGKGVFQVWKKSAQSKREEHPPF